MNGSLVTGIVMLLQLTLIPMLVKKLGSDRARKLIPAGNLVLSIVTQMWAAFGEAVPPVVEPAAYYQAGFLSSLGNTFLDIVVNSLLQTFLVTGAHSAAKNTLEAGKK